MKKSSRKTEYSEEITKLRQYVLELETIKTRERSAKKYLDMAGVIFITLDKNMLVTLANKKACEVFECNENQILNQRWPEILFRLHGKPSKNFHPHISSNQIKSGFTSQVEYFEGKFISKNGKEKIIAWHNAFIRDDKTMISEIICSGDDITERKLAEDALLKSKKKLEETNTALRVLLKKRDEDRSELKQDVQFNASKFVLPYVDKLLMTNSLENSQTSLLKAIKENIQRLVSPFPRQLFTMYINLTPSEIQVADMVKEGLRNKEIARLMNLSIKTVEFHRSNIRKKFGLKNKKSNLRSQLLSLK